MHGGGIGTLKLLDSDNKEVWSKDADQGDTWRRAGAVHPASANFTLGRRVAGGSRAFASSFVVVDMMQGRRGDLGRSRRTAPAGRFPPPVSTLGRAEPP